MLDAERACLARGHLALASRKLRIAGCSHSHVPGKVDGIVKTHSRAGFKVGGDQQRVFGELLHAIDDHHGFVHRAAKQNDPANMIVDNLMSDLLIRIAVLI